MNAFAQLNSTVHGFAAQALAPKPGYVQGWDLYKGVDFSQLSTAERWWAEYYAAIPPWLATGIMSFVFHELVYFGRCLPYWVLDQIPAMQKYKLQEKMPSKEEYLKSLKSVLLSHFTIQLPQIVSFGPICESLGLKTYHVPFPPATKMAWQIAIFFVLEDAWHYTFHRILHQVPWLYKNIHKQHHEFASPHSLTAEHASPMEIMLLGMGTIGPPFVLCYLTGGDLHVLTVYVWILLRLFQAIDAHSGYHFPFSMASYFPLWAGALHHDSHHENFTGNYASSFTYLDHIFGTDSLWKKQQARKRDIRRLMAEKGMTKADAKKEAIALEKQRETAKAH